MEHLGSIAEGEKFVFESLKRLQPGGIAIHTTEYNVSSNTETLETGGVVLFRRRDLESLSQKLIDAGHHIDIDFTLGKDSVDCIVQQPPYQPDLHLRIQIGPFIATSFGLIITKAM